MQLDMFTSAQLRIPVRFVQFSSLCVSYTVSECEIRCQLVTGFHFKVSNFIGLDNLEWHSQKEVANIGIRVL